MLDIDFIRENTKQVKDNLKDRGLEVDIDKLLELDETRRTLIQELQDLQEERNEKSKGSKPNEEEVEELRRLSDDIDELQQSLKEVKQDYFNLLSQVPNKIHPETPRGPEDEFEILEKHKEPPQFDFKPKTHLDLMEKKDLVDFDRGAKVVGSSFYFSKKDLVELTQALFDYALDIVKKYDFELLETPDLAKNEMIENAGFNPRGEESQIYNIEDSNFSLIGTSEITVLGYHSDEILDLSEGPRKYAAFSHCFRKEAGSYGKASKGLYRVHQFKKLELFIFCKPSKSEQLHEELLNLEKEIIEGLELPYRVVDIPTGDLGAPAYRKFDIESWMTMKGDDPSEGGYGELTSCSNCLDYQARRANIRFKNKQGDNEYVHTLNGTAIVSSRAPVAIFENFQNEDGSIDIPQALRGYLDQSKIE